MSETKTKEELIRLTWLTELRRQGHRQCRGDYADGAGNVCAVGLLIEITCGDLIKPLLSPTDMAGLSELQAVAVVQANDDKRMTFGEIADLVAGWFK